MREDIAGPQGASSRPMWETLEGMVREKAQEFIQQIMEEEVTELLGREKSERRSTADSARATATDMASRGRLAMSSGRSRHGPTTNPNARRENRGSIHARIDRLSPESIRRWGTMAAREMVCHAADQLRVALGDRKVHAGPLRLRFSGREVKVTPGLLRFRCFRRGLGRKASPSSGPRIVGLRR